MMPDNVWHDGNPCKKAIKRPWLGAVQMKLMLQWRPQDVGEIRTWTSTVESCSHGAELTQERKSPDDSIISPRSGHKAI